MNSMNKISLKEKAFKLGTSLEGLILYKNSLSKNFLIAMKVILKTKNSES